MVQGDGLYGCNQVIYLLSSSRKKSTPSYVIFLKLASLVKTTTMKKLTRLEIAEPCHENWNGMSAAEQGRYCNSCCKTVTDFSMMTDKEILQVLSKVGENSCGRFTKDQLHRPIYQEQPTHSRPYKFFLSALIPTFLFANAGMAQQNKSTDKKVKQATEKLMGRVARVECKVGEAKNDTSITNAGTILTDNKKPGNDELPLSSESMIMGGIQIFEKVTIADTVKTYVRKALNLNGFKVLGNPAVKGSVLNLQFKNEGKYMVQLLDASGRIALTTTVAVSDKSGTAQVMLPNNFIPGIYFIKATNEQKKSYTEKINVY